MNWIKIKERFPNCYPMIREFYQSYDGFERFVLNEFVISKGKAGYPLFVRSLEELEKELCTSTTTSK